MVRKEILPAKAIPRDPLSEQANNKEKQNKITFNMTYHPVFSMQYNIASDDRHEKVFHDVPLIGFKNNKNLKAHL